MQIDRRNRYRAFCEGRTDIPIFSQPWWLDAVCGEGSWCACIVERAGRVVGAMPFMYSARGMCRHIGMPPLTQNFKLWIQYTDTTRPEARLATEKEIITELINQLPPFHTFSLNFYRSLTNWLPFSWHGFRQTTRYTYVIEDLSDLAAVFAKFSHAKRKNIKKADTILEPGPELSAQEFFNHHSMTLKKSGDTIVYSYSLLQRIFKTAYEHSCGRVFTAVDTDKKIHAAIFVIWDALQAYYLISSIDPDYRSSGAATYLIRNAITYISPYTLRFDFEGSMIEGVENSFRQFGTVQVPYFQIEHSPSWLHRCVKAVRYVRTGHI